MKTVEEIKAAIEAAVPGAGVEIVRNPEPSGQHSLLLAPGAACCRKVPARRRGAGLDFLSNVTGVDWLDKEITEKVKVTRQVPKTVDGVEQPRWKRRSRRRASTSSRDIWKPSITFFLWRRSTGRW